MYSENIDEVIENFNNILIDIEAIEEADNEEFYCNIFGKIPPKPPHIEINFEKYLQDTYKGKIKLLKRSTFEQIKRPILIMFNHFQRKCAYQAKWLHLLSKLSQKYGNYIEFIAADILDIDVMHNEWKSLDYVCNLTSPERQAPYIFVMDERKRIYQYNNSNKSCENLMEICEKLLKGKLYFTEPLPLNNEECLVKKCVYGNYEELILKSKKHILLVVGKERGRNPYDTNYEQIAMALNDHNLEVFYLVAEKNYIPFEFNCRLYPTLIYFPENNKNIFSKFGYGCRREEYVITWLKQQIENGIKGSNDEKVTEQPLTYNLDNLEKYLSENFNNNIKLFNREYFNNFQLKRLNLVVIFVKLPLADSRLLNKYLQKIQQLKQNFKFEVEILIADYNKDFDIITQNCECDNFSEVSFENSIKIYAFDGQNHIYQYDFSTNLDNLYYFLNDLTRGQLYYSQLIPPTLKHNPTLVTSCVADNLMFYIRNCKKHIGLFIYSLNYKDNGKILAGLENIARKIKHHGVKLIKINAIVNYIPLEYRCNQYPVFYFISRSNKNKIKKCLSKNPQELIDFVRNNVNEYKE